MGLLDYVVKQNSSEVSKFNDYNHPDSELEKFRQEFSIFLRNEIGIKHPLTVENVDTLKVNKEPLCLPCIDIINHTSNTIEKKYIKYLILIKSNFDWLNHYIQEVLVDEYDIDDLYNDLYHECITDEEVLDSLVSYLHQNFSMGEISNKKCITFEDYKIYY